MYRYVYDLREVYLLDEDGLNEIQYDYNSPPCNLITTSYAYYNTDRYLLTEGVCIIR